MNEKVSVVVSCYNHEKYISECLRSIFEQTYKNIELLIFNDGSTDKSDEIISSLLPESPFKETYYFSAENQGLAFIKNKALKQITGSYLLFVDSDNFINSNHIEILLRAVIKTEMDIGYCQLWDFENQRNVLREDLTFEFDKMLEGNLIDASSLIRVSSIGEARFDLLLNNQKLEDYDFWLNMIINEKARPYFVKETSLNYRVLSSSMSERENWEKYYEIYFYILKKYISKIPTQIIEAAKANVLIFVKGYNDGVKELQVARKRIENQKDIIQEKDKELQVARKRIENQKDIIQEKDKEIKGLLDQLDVLNEDIVSIRENIGEIEKSRSFKIGRLLTLPVRKIKGILRK